ncbi:MAG: tRNA-dihydrouridine synthase [Candidatus Beckwithbacteria bacterium]|nr:tRNA-dihydrouridine synthase [Candidatus Beckwithbacteria bacterium]
MVNIWETLPKPIFCLAPMFGATDSAFRQLLCELGRPDLMFTEFINVQAIFSPDIKTVTQLLSYTSQEQPLIAQIWGLDPELFAAAADFIVRAGFAGIDINFGCPEPSVVKKGVGGALIDNPDLAGKIIQSTIKGAKGRLPVSVKTRLGYKTINIQPWFKFLLNFDLAAVSVHCRTTKKMSTGPAHWKEIKKIVALKNQFNPKTLIIGNGDIFSRETAYQRIRETGVDGIMIGRGVFKNPWIFNAVQTPKTKTDKIAAWQRHLEIYRQTWGEIKPIHPLKRFLKIYLKGFKGALKMRTQLMDSL